MSAATIVAALGLCGCSSGADPAPSATQQAPITNPPTPMSPAGAPLPEPAVLTDVMYKLADTNVPGAEKVGLVEYATPDDAPALDRFGKALRDGGFAPATIEANDLAWAQAHPGNVVANVVIKPANRQAGPDFVFPMEFSQERGTWQLTRESADTLLQLGQDPTATPTP